MRESLAAFSFESVRPRLDPMLAGVFRFVARRVNDPPVRVKAERQRGQVAGRPDVAACSSAEAMLA